MTEREFKQRKRKELNRLRGAMGAVNLGSAYLPDEADEAVWKAKRLIDEALTICRPWWKNA